MGFRIFSKIVIALGVVLVVVVLLEFVLLTFYVKETDADVPKTKINGVINLVTKDSRKIINPTSKTKTEMKQVKHEETKR